MRILRYTVENFKKIRFIDVEPGAIWTIFTGKNSQGKTSALQGLAALKHGKKALPEHPVRKGANKAKLEMLLSDEEGKPYLVAKGTASQDRGWSLLIEPAPGRVRPAGTSQEIMDDFVGLMAMDPLEFIAMKPKEQLDFLRVRLKVDVDLDDLANANRLDYAERTQVNNKVKELRAQAAAMVVSPGLPKEKVDEEAIQARIREAGDANRQIVARIAEKTRLAGLLYDAEENERRHMRLISDKEKLIQDLQKEEEDAQAMLVWAAGVGSTIEDKLLNGAPPKDRIFAIAQGLRNALESAKQFILDQKLRAGDRSREVGNALKVMEAARAAEQGLHDAVAAARVEWENAPAGEMVDTNELMGELHQAQLTNREIDKRLLRDDLEKQVQERERESAQLRRAMEAREEKKRDALAGANIPVKGLALHKDGVMYNNVLLSEAGDAEQMRVACALSMASLKPNQLRVMPIARGESLDEDSLKMIEEMAEANSFQIFMAKVDTTGKVGIVLEDGAVAAVNG